MGNSADARRRASVEGGHLAGCICLTCQPSRQPHYALCTKAEEARADVYYARMLRGISFTVKQELEVCERRIAVAEEFLAALTPAASAAVRSVAKIELEFAKRYEVGLYAELCKLRKLN